MWKLSDFGLAIEGKNDISAGTKDQGSHFYQPHEAIKGEYSHATDIFSLGMVAFELFVSHLPKNDDKDLELLRREEWFEYQFFELCTVGKDLKGFLEWMLNEDPEKRPTADEALEKLTEMGSKILPRDDAESEEN